MQIKSLLFFLIFFFSINFTFAQQGVTIGSSAFDHRGGSSYFDYSDPTTLNIKVSVWGYVASPGRYNIPIYTTPVDLLSFAGGPMVGADLKDIRIYRIKEDGTEEIIKLYYDDLINADNLEKKNRPIVTLKANDFLIIPGGPEYYFKDWLSISLSILSAVTSLTILILNLTGNL